MICYVLAMGKQHQGPHVVVGYGIKIVWPGLFITSPDHLDKTEEPCVSSVTDAIRTSVTPSAIAWCATFLVLNTF